ncbi:hypothetical protein N9K75_00625 [bacterium]|nr:hypothetical protein [bacterium]
MSKVILTRYLYLFDEVGLMFITSLLKNQSLDECNFWISELYLSGFVEQSWDLLWFAYYDFYYIINPHFQHFIHKKSLDDDLKSILTIVKNLFKLKSSSEVFMTRQYNNCIKDITHIFKGKKPNWLMAIPVKYHGLFRFIDKKLYQFAVSSLPDVVDTDIFKAIQIYFQLSDEQTMSFQNEFSQLSADQDQNQDQNNEVPLQPSADNEVPPSADQYKNAIHKLWAIICLLIFNRDYLSSKKKIYIACSDMEYKEVMKIHDDPIPLNKYNNLQIHKTLEHKRVYSIEPICSSFHLLRENVENINECYRRRWEFYAYLCPLWNKRFHKYNITVDSDEKKIVFHDDDELEEFYSEFGYEPDEQTYETENKRIVHMPENNWKTWYNSIFTSNQKPIYEFTEDFRFKY